MSSRFIYVYSPLLIFLILIVIVRLYLFEIYEIQSNSMATALISGDAVLIRKLQNNTIFCSQRKITNSENPDYERHQICAPEKKDIIIFRLPQCQPEAKDKIEYNNEYIAKRCFAAPGEFVLINNGKNTSKKESVFAGLIYEKNTILNLSCVDTIWIPEKGYSLHLTSKNYKYYSDIIISEGNVAFCKNDSIFINNNYAAKYTFKENYYFMLGDNLKNSLDSRKWGLLPQSNIVGKTVVILFSLDPDTPWYRKFRWNRLLKKIE